MTNSSFRPLPAVLFFVHRSCCRLFPLRGTRLWAPPCRCKVHCCEGKAFGTNDCLLGLGVDGWNDCPGAIHDACITTARFIVAHPHRDPEGAHQRDPVVCSHAAGRGLRAGGIPCCGWVYNSVGTDSSTSWKSARAPNCLPDGAVSPVAAQGQLGLSGSYYFTANNNGNPAAASLRQLRQDGSCGDLSSRSGRAIRLL